MRTECERYHVPFSPDDYVHGSIYQMGGFRFGSAGTGTAAMTAVVTRQRTPTGVGTRRENPPPHSRSGRRRRQDPC